MESRAVSRYVRITPRKARLIVDLVRGRGVEDALNILDATPKRAARAVAKNLRSAVANAENQQTVDVDKLFTHRWKLEQAEEAYTLFDTQTTGKGVFLM